MFQDGIIAQAVDVVKAAGVSYFSAAGNNGRDSYEAPFDPSGLANPPGRGLTGILHDFDPGPGAPDTCQTITIPTGTTIFSFQWTEPFFSISGAPGSASDLDIGLYTDADGCAHRSFLFGGLDSNIGTDPVEVFGLTNDGPPVSLGLQISLFAGPIPDLLKYVVFSSTAFSIDEFDTASSTIYGHANAAGAEAVGAAFYAETPEFGVAPPLLEPFSSAGPTPIFFDTSGLPTFDLRDKPEIVAPDGTNTTFFGFDVEPDSFPNFFGTSAAAPHAAAVAALMLEAAGGLTPAEVYSALESTAIDMDDPATGGFDVGFDFGTGFGLIDAVLAVSSVAPPTRTLTSISVTPASGASIAAGQTQQFTATGTFDDDSTADLTSSVTWLSSNQAVATISSNGLATGVAAGSTVITATQDGFTSLDVVLEITPQPRLVSITVTPDTGVSVDEGQTQQFTATGTFDDDSTADLTSSVTWLSSNQAVATINANGLATGVSAGSTAITATQDGVTSKSASLEVLSPPSDLVTILSAEYNATRKEFKVRATSSTQPDAVLTVVDFGQMIFKKDKYELKIKPLAPEQVPSSVTVQSSHGGLDTAVVQGAPAPPAALVSITVTPSNPSVGVGLTLQFTATGTFDDQSTADLTSSVTWHISASSVATIDATTGLATGVSVGTTSISATEDGVTSTAVELGVTPPPALVSIAVTPNAGVSIGKGQSLQFTATGTFVDGSTADLTTAVSWASSLESVATIDSAGLATGVAVGTSSITAMLDDVTSLPPWCSRSWRPTS